MKRTILMLWLSAFLTGCSKDFGNSGGQSKIQTYAKGIVSDVFSLKPVAGAKVYLMKTTGRASYDFDTWKAVDSTIADRNGRYYIDYIAAKDSSYAVYPEHEQYFRVKEVNFIVEKDTMGCQLYPISFLKIHLKDVPPYSDYQWVHFVPSFEPIYVLQLQDLHQPVDTTFYYHLSSQIDRGVVGAFFHKNQFWYGSVFQFPCNSLDTCAYEILY